MSCLQVTKQLISIVQLRIWANVMLGRCCWLEGNFLLILYCIHIGAQGDGSELMASHEESASLYASQAELLREAKFMRAKESKLQGGGALVKRGS